MTRNVFNTKHFLLFVEMGKLTFPTSIFCNIESSFPETLFGILFFKLLPDTVMVCLLEGVPCVVRKVFKVSANTICEAKWKVMMLFASCMLDKGFLISVPSRSLGVKELIFAAPGNGSPERFASLANPSASTISKPMASALLLGEFELQELAL